MPIRNASPCLYAFCLLLLAAPLDQAVAQTTILKAAGMIDVEAGQLIQPATLVIVDGRIQQVNPAQEPAEAEVLDLGNLILLPGFIDMHTHLTSDLEGDWVHRPVKEGVADLALRGARNAGRTLQAGFTTVRDVGSSGFADIALMRAIDQGLVEGPRMVPAAHSLSITGGHCDATGWAPGILEGSPETGVADGVDGVLKAARYQIKHGARVIKVCATAGVLSFEGPVGAQQFTAEELRAIVEEADRHGLKVAAHAHGADGIVAAIQAGVASIEHGSILTDEALQMMVAQGTYLVPTTYLTQAVDLDALPPPIRAKAEFIVPQAQESLTRAIQAGVKIAFGTDAAVFPHGDNAKEFAALVERGMTPLAALQAATLNAIDLLGVDDRGRLAPGLLADIVAVPGNPLNDIRVVEDVRFVMKDGQVYKHPDQIPGSN